MSKKTFLLTPVFACSLLLLTGVWSHQGRSSPQLAESSFVPQITKTGGLPLSAGALLDNAIAKLERLDWLETTIWQRLEDEVLRFQSEGRLVLGPNHCARLETAVDAGGSKVRVEVVSDGQVLAHVIRFGDQAPQETTIKLPATDGSADAALRAQNSAILAAKGCGGPLPLLLELQNRLDGLTAIQGEWHTTPVIRLTGTIKPGEAVHELFRFQAHARQCHVYLDAKTLWPMRVEWLGNARIGQPQTLFLEIEFREPRLNHSLSHPECVRAFSYQPG